MSERALKLLVVDDNPADVERAVVMGALCFECGRKVSADPARKRFPH